MTNKLVCLILLGCFGLFQTVCCQTNTCSYVPCNCCLENATCQSNGHCGGQCKDGYHGGKCLSNCPINCLTCKDRDNPNNNPSFYGVANCTSCKPGYYSTPESFQCQLNCPDECETCNSDTDCTSCKTGYYISIFGDVSGQRNCTQCSEGCWNKTCNNRTGVCNCTSTNYSGDKCDSCAQNIEKYPQCNQCIAGLYGPDCKHYCPVNCNGKVCNRQTGNCIDGCNKNFTGDSCTFCLDGLHGYNCHKKCPANCDGGVCNQSNGHCHSCKSNFTGETCDSCINGQYGINCDFFCPSHCYDSLCNRTTGNCDSCQNGQSGDKCCIQGTGCQSCLSEYICLECVQGTHGDQCDEECPSNCAKNFCNKGNGTCIACADGFNGDYCTLQLTSTKAATGPDVLVAGIASGVIVGLVVIIALLSLIIFFQRRKYSSSSESKNTRTMANTESQTPERVYANDAAITAASNECNTYEILASTSNTIPDYEALSVGAFLVQGETRSLTKQEMTGIINKLGASMKSDKADKSQNQDKSVKPEMGLKRYKLHKVAKACKMPQQPVAPLKDEHDYYNCEEQFNFCQECVCAYLQTFDHHSKLNRETNFINHLVFI